MELLSGNFKLTDIIISTLSSFVVVFCTMPIHEFAHALIATKLGDPTPRYQGRLTVNPFAHLDLFGALSMVLLGVGWAKPVQVNPRNFKNPKVGMAITAFAGPAANIISATVSMLLAYVFVAFGSALGVISVYAIDFFVNIAFFNVYLAVFNFIPVPPFDGSRILFAILPDKYYWQVMKYERILMFIMLIVIASKHLSAPISIVANAIFGVISYITYLPFSFFF